jgi:hypothetical protein
MMAGEAACTAALSDIYNGAVLTADSGFFAYR